VRASSGFIVWGVGIGAVMPPFLGFVALGLPHGAPARREVVL
jgi:hypothetical protein